VLGFNIIYSIESNTNMQQDNNIRDKTKTSFVLYKDLYHVISELPDEMAGRLFKIILFYVNNEAFEIEDFALKMAWLPIKLQLDRDSVKYQQKCDKNKANAQKRWKNQNANASDGMRVDAKHADTDNDTDNDNDNDTDNNNKSLDEVFLDYLELIKSDKEKVWRDSIYSKFKIENGSLQKLLNDFKLSEVSSGKNKLDDNLKSFKIHFRNWLNKIDELGNLEKYRSFKHKKSSGI